MGAIRKRVEEALRKGRGFHDCCLFPEADLEREQVEKLNKKKSSVGVRWILTAKDCLLHEDEKKKKRYCIWSPMATDGRRTTGFFVVLLNFKKIKLHLIVSIKRIRLQQIDIYYG